MSDENKDVSAGAGSTPTVPAAGAGQTDNSAAAGAQAGQQGQVNPAQNYAELEKKLGEQGTELGQYRDFIKQVTPILTKIDANPELIQAIMDDKLDTKLVSAILAGKVKVEEAQQVAAAHEQVKTEMGNQAYQNANPADIEKAILDKIVPQVTSQIEQKFKTADEIKEFEASVQSFISNTPDFADFSDKISVWLSEHPDQDDIEVAYAAVKGIELSKKFAAEGDVAAAEAAKQAALNAAGGQTPSGGQVNPQRNPIDDLIGGPSNPNSFKF